MQLDSHHRFVKDWDTKCIQMLHSCDAGEYSVLTTYGNGFAPIEIDYGDLDQFPDEVKTTMQFIDHIK